MSITAITTEKLLDSVTSAGAGEGKELAKKENSSATFQAVANGTSGAYSATVEVQFSNDYINWNTGITFSLSGTATTADTAGDNISAPWKYVRGNIPAGGITGTGANVTLTMGS